VIVNVSKNEAVALENVEVYASGSHLHHIYFLEILHASLKGFSCSLQQRQ
jgi:hypothetical protein